MLSPQEHTSVVVSVRGMQRDLLMIAFLNLQWVQVGQVTLRQLVALSDSRRWHLLHRRVRLRFPLRTSNHIPSRRQYMLPIVHYLLITSCARWIASRTLRCVFEQSCLAKDQVLCRRIRIAPSVSHNIVAFKGGILPLFFYFPLLSYGIFSV